MFRLLAIKFRFTLKIPNTSSMHCSGAQYAVEKMMRKIMMTERKKKHKYNTTPLLLPPANLSKGSYEGKRSGNSKRVDVLNKLFMRYITDLMTSKDYSTELFGHGIEISRVQVTPDYKAVHVLWICNVAKEDQVESKLKSISGDLRCELANLNIVGMIPKIAFFKDKDYSKVLRLDERLAIADFGEDYEPQQYKNNLKIQLKLQMRLDESTKLKISNLEKENLDHDIGEPLPDMPQNVLGLNHADILNNITKKIKNATSPIACPSPDIVKLATINESPIKFSNMKAQNDAFKEFLIKRKILESKMNREKHNSRAEFEYTREQLMSNSNYESNTDKDLYFDDFIEDEET